MFKKCVVLFLAVCFLTTPAFAAGQKLPTWLSETGATPVSDAQLENVQGEFAFTATTLAVYYYIVSTGYSYYPAIYAFLNNMASRGMGRFSGILDWVRTHK